MARKPPTSKDKNQNGLSADEFQRQLLNWFQDRGLLADLQTHLRHQMIVALKDTSLNIHSAGTFHQAGSPKLQAINLLVAEFLLRQQCHYTLSVFTSEVPLLRNLPEFSSAVSNSSSHVEPDSHEDRFPGFHERDVFDILEALGFASNSEESQMINDLYEHSQGESLLTCLIRSLPNTYRANGKTVSRSESPEPKSMIDQRTALQQCPLFAEDVCIVIQQSNLDGEQIAELHDAVKRIIDNEVNQVQKTEEAKYRQELIDREERIQAVWSQHDEEMQENKKKSEETLNNERLKLAKELQQKQAQFAVLAAQLRDQQHEVASRLNYIQERNDVLEKKEAELNIYRKESEEHLNRKQEELDGKEKDLEGQQLRLEAEMRATELERRDLEANRIQIEAASRAIKESQVEIALLRDLQSQYTQLKVPPGNLSTNEVEAHGKNSDTSVKIIKVSSQGVQANLPKQRGAVPKKHNAHQQTHQVLLENQSLQTQISGTDMDDMFLQLHQQTTENERRHSEHQMIGNLVDQLQQENLELRGHIEQQRLRIQEVTAQSSELMHRLSNAHTTITRLRTEPALPEHEHHGVQTSPRSSSDTQATPSAIPVRDSVPGLALGAYGYHSPTPAYPQSRPVTEARPPARGFVRSSQVGAGEESYFSRRLPPETYAPLYSSPNHREQRRKPPRRFMVHSVSSSDDSCPSPTEDMLREARRRLRRLEDETAAIDRSYQEFRLRNAENLTNTASILFQPLALSGDYGRNFPLSTPPNIPPRPFSPSPPVFSFPANYSRSRLYAARIGLLNQFQSTTVLQPGILQPYPFFPFARTHDQPRSNFSFTSGQVQSSSSVNPLYTVPTQMFPTCPQSSTGGSATTMAHGPPLSSARIQNDVQSNNLPRGSVSDLRLPAGFSLREHSRYVGERESLQHLNLHQQNKRWTQEPPPCTSSVPHIPIVTQENELQNTDNTSQSEREKPLVFLHRDNLNTRVPAEHNVRRHQILEHLTTPAGSEILASYEVQKENSPQGAINQNTAKSETSSPKRTILLGEHSQSRPDSSRSCSEKYNSGNALCEGSNISEHKLSELLPPSSGVTRLSKIEEQEDKVISPRQHSYAKEVIALHNDSPKLSSGDRSTGSSIPSLKESSPNKCPCLENVREDCPLAPGSSKATSECQEKDNAEKETNEVSDNVKLGEEASQALNSVKEPISEAPMVNRSVIEIETASENASSKVDSLNVKKKQIKPEQMKPIVSELSENRAQDISRISNERPHTEVPAVQIEDNGVRHSNSPSLPSTLGSSNELSSDVISAGEERSEDSW